MDKKVLAVLIILAAILVLGGLAVYSNVRVPNSEVQNSTGGAQSGPLPEVQIQAEGDSGTGNGTFTVCLDNCGDGICQAEDQDCGKNGLNCICAENKQECPQDCK